MAGKFRSGLTLGGLTLLGFASVMVVHFGTSRSLTATLAPRALSHGPIYDLPPLSSASATVQSVAAPTPAPARKDAKPERISPEIARSLGEAGGKIHFAGGEDFEISRSIALWLPGENRVRVVFLESLPKAANLAELLDAVQSGNLHTVAERIAFVDLQFNSAAQTVDNNALASARLTLIDGASMSTADAFNSLDWQGALPTAEARAQGAMPRIALRAARESSDLDDEPGRPTWQLSLSAPVIVRD